MPDAVLGAEHRSQTVSTVLIMVNFNNWLSGGRRKSLISTVCLFLNAPTTTYYETDVMFWSMNLGKGSK